MTIEKARKTMAEEFERDPDFRRVYVSNVACCLMDHIPGLNRDKAKRDAIADGIIYLLFER